MNKVPVSYLLLLYYTIYCGIHPMWLCSKPSSNMFLTKSRLDVEFPNLTVFFCRVRHGIASMFLIDLPLIIN